MSNISFIAELKETKQRKGASLDNEYSIKFVTEDSTVIELAKLPSDTLFKITVETAER